MKEPISYEQFKSLFCCVREDKDYDAASVLAYGILLLGQVKTEHVQMAIGFIQGSMDINDRTALGGNWETKAQLFR